MRCIANLVLFMKCINHKKGLWQNVKKNNYQIGGLSLIPIGHLILKIVSPLDPRSVIVIHNPAIRAFNYTFSCNILKP